MNKEEAKKELEVLKKREAELTTIINTPDITPKERLLGLFKGLVMDFDFDKYPGSVFYRNARGEFMFEQDFKSGYLWCSYKNVWQIFYDEYSMGYQQVKYRIRDTVEEHFKWKGLTPIYKIPLLTS